MSVFAKFVTKAVAVGEHTVTIQKLSGRDVERAQTIAASSLVNGRGFAERLAKALAAAKAGNELPVHEIVTDPLNGFDRSTVLRAGIAGWTFPDAPKTDEHIDALDDETSELLAREIVRLTKPHLFTDAETERKNV